MGIQYTQTTHTTIPVWQVTTSYTNSFSSIDPIDPATPKELHSRYINSTHLLTKNVDYPPAILGIKRCISSLLTKITNLEISQNDFDQIIKDTRELTQGLKNGYLIEATAKYLSETPKNKYNAVFGAALHLTRQCPNQ